MNYTHPPIQYATNDISKKKGEYHDGDKTFPFHRPALSIFGRQSDYLPLFFQYGNQQKNEKDLFIFITTIQTGKIRFS